MLATASAHVQGKTLVEVCTVYGVATVALEDGQSQPTPDHQAGHGDEHCALTALMVLSVSAPDYTELFVLLAPARAPPGHSRASSNAPDACATWVARLKHGPPFFA